MTKLEVEGKIISKGEKRVVNLKTGGQSSVCDFILEDESGKIKLPLWGADIEKFYVGQNVKITNGYSTIFKNVTSLNVGKYGSIEII